MNNSNQTQTISTDHKHQHTTFYHQPHPDQISHQNINITSSKTNNKSFQNKQKKQSSRKISLKSSHAMVKEIKDHSVNQILLPKNKVNTQSYHHNQPERQKLKSHHNPNSINKSLIFSQQKLTNSQHYSVLKHTTTANLKIIGGSDNKAHNKKTNKDKQHQTHGNSVYYEKNPHEKAGHKKHSTKGSTTKKHSKSVYNYTEFDEYPVAMQRKKHSEKKQAAMGIISGMGVCRKSRDSHNRSTLTHHNNPQHQISTSSITKRVTKSKQSLLNKLLTNSSIKKTTSNFKVLSKCLQQCIKEEQLANNKIDISQIIKMVKAFNKTEIGQLSKPLEELVCEIVGLIQVGVGEGSKLSKEQSKINKLNYQKGDNARSKQQLRGEQIRFKTPQRLAQRYNQQQQTFPSSINNRNLNEHYCPNEYVEESQIVLNPNDISKTKKFMNNNHINDNHINNNNMNNNHINSQSSSFAKHPTSSLSRDLIKMQQGLQELKSESKQLQQIIYSSSGKKKHKPTQMQQRSSSQQEEDDDQQQGHEIEQKKIEIHRLRQILSRQEYLMDKIERLSQFQEQQAQGQDDGDGESEDLNDRQGTCDHLMNRKGNILREE